MARRDDYRKPRVSDDGLWLWGQLMDFERKGLLSPAAAGHVLREAMPLWMARDIFRYGRKLKGLLSEIDAGNAKGGDRG